MRHLDIVSLVLGLSATTFACGGTPHDSPDGVVFGAPVILSCPSGAVSGAKLGNFGGGKQSDIVGCTTRDSVSVFRNDGAGTFANGKLANVSTRGFEVLDVDGDGLSDIAYVDSDGKTYIALARKDGTFAPPFAQPTYPFGAEKRFTIDGYRNAISYDYEQKSVSFYDLANDGSTTLIKSVPVPSEPYFVDLDGDGNVDMAFAVGSTVAIELGLGHGAFGPTQVIMLADDTVNNVRFGDLDGDGSTDVIVETGSSKTGHTYFLAESKGGAFEVVNTFAEVEDVDYDFEDVTGDGIVDIVLSEDAQIVIMVGKGDGTFADKALLVTGPWTHAAFVFSDLNGDGKPDLVVGDPENVSVLLRQ